MLSFLARDDIRIEWKVRNCYRYEDVLMILFEELEKGRALLRMSTAGLVNVLVELSARLFIWLLSRGSRYKWGHLGPGEKVPIWKGFTSFLMELPIFPLQTWRKAAQQWLALYSCRAGGQGGNPREDPGRQTKTK